MADTRSPTTTTTTTMTMAAPVITSTDQYPRELQYVKALFFQKQYRQVIRACLDLLMLMGKEGGDRPLQKAFCLFYVGVAHDELARAMHRNSQAKVPAFTAAALFYKKAHEALPSPDQARELCKRMAAQREDSFTSSIGTDLSTSWTDSLKQQLLEHAASEPTLSPQAQRTHIRDDSIDFDAPGTSLPRSTSETSDLESHDSFNEILTPNKMLTRDYSRMSLLETPPKSLARGVRQPTRSGQLPNPHLQNSPPRRAYSSVASSMRGSALPKLITHERCDSGFPSAASRWVSPEATSPVSPVSPLAREDFSWETSTISPVSPETPSYEDTPPWETAPPSPSDATTPLPPREEVAIDDDKLAQLTTNVAAMRTQLTAHITLVQTAKDQLQRKKSEKVKPAAPTKGTPLDSPASGKDAYDADTEVGKSSSACIQQARSYWSFTPVNVKEEEKNRRIQAGRARNWARERFRPERYQALAERALAEL